MAKREVRPSVDASENRSTRPWLKAVISLLLLFHVTAVFIAPFAFASNVGGQARSPFADPIAQAMRPYVVAMFLDHGYFFFAPNPGPTHLVDYKVEFDDGRPAIEGRFPNLETHRPRLLFHRHFMLAEALNNAYTPPTKPPEPSPPPLTATAAERAQYEVDRQAYAEMEAGWRRARETYEAMRQSIEQHLLAKHGGDRVTVRRIEHRPPMPDEFAILRKPLSAPDSYTTMPETVEQGGVR